MQFSIKWAAATPVYVGMIFAVLKIMVHASSAGERVFAFFAGMFMGGAAGLPAAAGNLVVALVVAALLRAQPFALQFIAFALGSALINTWQLDFWDRGLRTMGGLNLNAREMTLLYLLGAASLALALFLMWRDAPHHA